MPRRPTRRTLNILGRQAERITTPPRKRRTGNRKTRTAAKSAERAMQRSLTDAVEAARDQVNLGYLRSTIERRDVAAAIDAIGWESAGEPVLRSGHAAAYQRAFNTSALLEAEALGAKYSVINRHALTAMEQAGARFVREIGEGTRAELRSILTDMLNRGLSVRDTATMLMDRVGLTARLSKAVDTFTAKLDAKGWAADRIAKASARKAGQLLRYRANLIAQTEAQNASAAGQRAGWAEAVTQGLVDPEVAEVEWVTSSKPCPNICDGMNGQRRKLGELFQTDDGRLVQGPGGETHPGCLCTTIMYTNRKRAAA